MPGADQDCPRGKLMSAPAFCSFKPMGKLPDWAKPKPPKPVRPKLTPELFAQLVEEGAALRQQYEKDSAPMRWITAEDLQTRCR